MTRDDIIRMAREAGADCEFAVHIPAWDMSTWEFMKRFADIVATAEREACARVCEMTYEGAFEGTRPCFDTPQECAAAIRARGQA